MVRTTKVLILESIYRSFSPLIQIFRLFGIFPLLVKRNKDGVFLKWSPWLATYSYFLGFLIIAVTLYGAVTENFLRETVELVDASFMDKLVTLFPLSGYCASTFFGVFIVASKTSEIFNYFNCIKEGDSIIKTTCSKFDEYKSLLVPIIVFINSEIIHFINVYMFKTLIGDKSDVIKKIVTRHAPFLMTIYVSLMIEYLIRLMTYNLELRFIRLNDVLREHYTKMREEEAKLKNSLEIISVSEESLSDHEPINFNDEGDVILKLNSVYSTLIQAANMINDLFGLNILVVLTATFFDLISTSYFLILVLKGKQARNLELIIQLFIFSFNVLRVLVITEPLYGCLVKVNAIAAQVCNLLTLNVGQIYRQQVNTFAVSISLQQFEFSACGLFNVDRLLISTLIGGVTNYVVILLGMKQDV